MSGNPAQSLLDSNQENRLLSDGEPSDAVIMNAFRTHPSANVLTVTKACTSINQLVTENGFPGQQPLMTVHFDCNMPTVPLYEGMILLTKKKRQGPQLSKQTGGHHKDDSEQLFLFL